MCVNVRQTRVQISAQSVTDWDPEPGTCCPCTTCSYEGREYTVWLSLVCPVSSLRPVSVVWLWGTQSRP